MVHQIEIDLPPRKKQRKGDPLPDAERPKGEDVYEEIIRGQFGYQEVETGFIVLLGACGQTDHVWHEEKSRGEFMEWKALRESLSFALDVNDYRDFLGVSTELIDDERLWEFMHETRSVSKFIPDEARRESRVWLAQHKPLE